MLLIKRNPEFPTMESFLNDFFGRNLLENNYDFAPKAKIKENEKDYSLSLALPGFKKEDVNINIEDNVLILSSQVEKDDFKKSFENRYSTPDDVDIEKINASMEDGILKLVFSKYEELPKSSIKKIDIK